MEAAIPRVLPFELMERQQHYRYRNIADLSMHTLLRFEGHLEPPVLARALRLSADLFPLLGCRVEEGFWGLRWVRRDDLDALPWCEVEETSDPEASLRSW